MEDVFVFENANHSNIWFNPKTTNPMLEIKTIRDAFLIFILLCFSVPKA